MDFDGYYYEDGTCGIPMLYEPEEAIIVIYDADGYPMESNRITMGFNVGSV